ncbi:UNVERIFIED_CONTAM: hypothetical protein Scaly_1259800 [Sesamum calycinum]|uniref:Uncharacterized protein n=1 Tax=Sesamum calycinum TaxID=2727403 RepID=A0AAW2Q676_9LAMI
MAGFLNLGNMAKKVESTLAHAPGEALGFLSNTATAVAHGIADVPKILFMQKGSAESKPIANVKRPAAAILYDWEIQEQQIESLLDEIDVLILSENMMFQSYGGQGLTTLSILQTAKEKGVEVVLFSDPAYSNNLEEAGATIVPSSDSPVILMGEGAGVASTTPIEDALNGMNTVIWPGGSGTISESAKERIERKLQELEEKGVAIFVLAPSISGTKTGSSHSMDDESIMKKGDQLGMVHHGG